MFKYEPHEMGVGEEPVLAHVNERFRETMVPVEDEIRYLGNAWNYCGYFHKELKDCVEEGVAAGNTKLFAACKNSVENLHHCYSWREPTEFKYDNAFVKETEECLLPRDMFIKCYFRQAAPWQVCQSYWTDIYRCKYRKHPAAFNFN